MNNKDIQIMLKYIPDDRKEAFFKEMGFDTTYRGNRYMERCFIEDCQGLLEKSVSDHFEKLREKNVDVPWDFNEMTTEEIKSMSMLFQWMSTNCGFAELTVAFNKGGYTLRRCKIGEDS